MKKTILTFLGYYLLISCNSNEKIIINGDIRNTKIKKVYFTDAYKWEIHLDSADVINEKFQFKIDKKSLDGTLYSICSKDEMGSIKGIEFKNHVLTTDTSRYYMSAFFIDTSTITITGDWNNEKNEWYNIQASKETDAFFSTQMMQFGGLSPDIETRTSQLDTYISLIKTYPNSQYLLSKINENKALINKSELDLMLRNFNSNSLQTGVGKRLQNYLSAKVDNPVFKNVILENKESSPSNIYDPSAKINMLVVWASWCGPCRQEIPELKKLYNLYTKRGLAITSISIDDTNEAWQKALKVENMSWKQLIVPAEGKDSFNKAFEVGSIPYLMFVDGNGKLLNRFIGYEKNQIEEYKKIIEDKL